MKTLTHFKIENLSQLEKAYRDDYSKYDDNYEQLKEQFEKGEKILQCNTFGLIYLDKQPMATSI